MNTQQVQPWPSTGPNTNSSAIRIQETGRVVLGIADSKKGVSYREFIDIEKAFDFITQTLNLPIDYNG